MTGFQHEGAGSVAEHVVDHLSLAAFRHSVRTETQHAAGVAAADQRPAHAEGTGQRCATLLTYSYRHRTRQAQFVLEAACGVAKSIYEWSGP